MKTLSKIPNVLLILLVLISCEKEETKSDDNSGDVSFLQEHIFNGNTQWIVSHMEADMERELNGKSTKVWSDEFPDCRKDNVYQFGTLGVKISSIDLDESSSTCDPEEPDYVSQGFFLEFSSDFTKAAVSVRGAAMAKLFHLPYDSRIKLNGFRHTWQFEEVSKDKVVVKALIPSDQSAGMAEIATEVLIVFERHH